MDELRHEILVAVAHVAAIRIAGRKCAAREFDLSMHTKVRAADGVRYTLREYCDYYGTLDGVWVLYERLQVGNSCLVCRFRIGSLDPFDFFFFFFLAFVALCAAVETWEPCDA